MLLSSDRTRGSLLDDIAKQVEEHLREGLYFFSIGQLLEGRRLWRQALELAPGHPVLEDYLTSTNKELTPEEQKTEESDVEGLSGVVETDSWDEEITGELDSLWGVQGEAAVQEDSSKRGTGSDSSAWDLAPDGGWEDEEPALGAASSSKSEDTGAWGKTQSDGWGDETPTEVGMRFDGGIKAAKNREADDHLVKAKVALEKGDLSGARVQLDAIFLTEPGNVEALQCLEDLKTAALALLTPSSIPERQMDMNAVSCLNLDMVEGYILSRIDGMTCVEDLYALIGHLDSARVGEVLASFLQQRVISLKA